LIFVVEGIRSGIISAVNLCSYVEHDNTYNVLQHWLVVVFWSDAVTVVHWTFSDVRWGEVTSCV